jgi:hypothetical protein
MCAGKTEKKGTEQTSLSLSKPVKNVIWILAKDTILRASLVVFLCWHYSDGILKTSAFLVCAPLSLSPRCQLLEAGNPECSPLIPGGLEIFSEQ